MATSKKHSTVVMILGGVVAAVGVIALLRYFKSKKAPNEKLPDYNSTGKTVVIPAVSSAWPMKNGSKGDTVKQLQTLLGVSADGIFGPLTQAALLAKTGKISIASQSDFNTIVATLNSKTATSANQSRASDLVAKWNSGWTYKLMAIANVTAYGVIQDAAGALILTGKNLSMKANLQLSRTDYKPVGTTTAGFLKFEVLNGDLKGTYKVDPAKMTVV